MTFPLWTYILAQTFSLFVGLYSYQKKSVSVSGFFSLLLISSLFIWLDHIPLLIIIFSMFVSSSLLTKFKEEKKREFKEVVSKTGPRDYVQAICNLGTATICMLGYNFSGEVYWVAGLVGSVAASNADSWASEIGGLSGKQPVLITNFKPIPKGISGGVTLLGTVGGILGAFFISSVSIIALLLTNLNTLELSSIYYTGVIAGIFGFVFDSYMGAWTQALYKTADNKSTENPLKAELSKGWRWMDNDMVNLITTIISSILSILCNYFILL